MISSKDLGTVVQKARQDGTGKSFKQSFELLASLKDIDLKKTPLNINEVVLLPHGFTRKPKVCVLATGDLALRAQQGGADTVLGPDDITRLGGQKREARKLARSYDFFLAEARLMAAVGRSLGPHLGPLGKMPTPLPPNAPVDAMIKGLISSVRIRSRSQLAMTCKVGDEGMSDEQVSENAVAVLGVVEKKLPSGMRNVKNVRVKLTMGRVANIPVGA